MSVLIVYPGTFSPPTYGHLFVVKQTLRAFNQLTIVCSKNQNKRPLFSQDEAKQLWLTYGLPTTVKVLTFAEISRLKSKDTPTVIMIRGIRDSEDLLHETKVIVENSSTLDIHQYHLILADQTTSHISSTKARQLAADLNLPDLAKMVSPLVVSALLERSLGLKKIYLVVGRPGAGKTSILEATQKIDSTNRHLNTDHYLDKVKPTLKEKFKTSDLTRLAIDHPEELKSQIGAIWLHCLTTDLRKLPSGSTAFVEVPYALKPDMQLHRLIGGRIIQIGCETEDEHRQRILLRGTPEHLPFLDLIPNIEQTEAIAKREKLELTTLISKRNENPLTAAHCLLDQLKEKEN